MYPGIELPPPIFQIGLKAHLFGAAAVTLAVEAEKAAVEHGVTVILAPQTIDAPAILAATGRLIVFAQHMDSVAVGRGTGRVLAEGLKVAGVHGTMLNHSERRLPMDEIERCVRRADEVGLATEVCAESPEEAEAIARLSPNIVLAEPPSLIGGPASVGRAMASFVSRTLELVRAVDPRIAVMCAAGVRTPEDVARMIELGVQGTGSSTAIVTATDPAAQAGTMIAAMGEAWRKRGSGR